MHYFKSFCHDLPLIENDRINLIINQMYSNKNTFLKYHKYKQVQMYKFINTTITLPYIFISSFSLWENYFIVDVTDKLRYYLLPYNGRIMYSSL